MVVVVVFLRYFDFVGWAIGKTSGSSYPKDSCLADREQCEVAPVHWPVKEKTRRPASADRTAGATNFRRDLEAT